MTQTAAPIVWIDPQTGSQRCSCGWVRPATFRRDKQTPAEILLDLSQAETHANTCGVHAAYLARQVRDLPRILGEPVPDPVIGLLETLIASPVVGGRRIVARWLTDLEEEAL